MAKILVKRLSQGERGVVGVFDQALTRSSGLFIASIAERALVPLSIVLRAGPSGARLRAGDLSRSLLGLNLLGAQSIPCDRSRPDRRSWHALYRWLASHTGVLGARVLPPRLPGSWRQGAWQMLEGRRLGGGISPGATVVENGAL